MKGIKYSAKEKEKALKLWIVDGKDVLWVAKKFKCTIQSIYRWRRLYDGSSVSLQNKSSRPHTPHPNAHTADESAHIAEILKDNPDITYVEMLGVLRSKYGYSRTYGGLYRYIVRNSLRPTEECEKYIAQPYDTPEMLGVKMQMDVKFVPRDCNRGKFVKEWVYQYTIIDEATRERFLYPYKEHSGWSTVDFIKRAIVYFGYIPAIIQTDNGTEFTNPKGTGDGKKHIVDKLLDKLGIKHQLIRAYTPRHNGKVERSHRSDSEGFYKTLTFTTFEELKEKMRDWNNRYNNRPHSSLRDKNGKRSWQSPIEKRNELLEQLREDGGYHLRLLKHKAS